jgi:thioredoxin-related protein
MRLSGFKGVGYFRVLLMAMAMSLVAPSLYADALPEARDFSRDAKVAKRKNIPILVFFATRDCPYCETVETLYLQPLYASKTYKGKVLFRVVRTESVTSLRDFNGKRTDHEDFASAQGVFFTPVIRLYNASGKELSELYGYTSPDYYSGELTNLIDKSIAKLALAKKG